MHLMEHRGWRSKVDERVARRRMQWLAGLFFVLAFCAPALRWQHKLVRQYAGNECAGTCESPSAILRPSLEILETAVGEMTLDKWKASPAIRTEADGIFARSSATWRPPCRRCWQPRCRT